MLRIHNHYISRLTVALICVESILLIIAFYLGVSIQFTYWNESSSPSFFLLLSQAIIFIFVVVSSMVAMGMYQIDSQPNFQATLLRLMSCMVFCFGLLAALYYLISEFFLSHGILLIVMSLSLFGILLARIMLFKWLSMGVLQSRVLVLGAGDSANKLNHQIKEESSYCKQQIIGFVPFSGEEYCVPASQILPIETSLISLVRKHNVEEIIVATENRRNGSLPIQELLKCKMIGVQVTEIASYFERELGHVRTNSLHPSWLVFGGGFDQSILRSHTKRVFDIIASIILLILSLPVMLGAILCILIEDGFPIFYRQERVGKNGQTFMVLKLRSMRKDAEKNNKPQWAALNDTRITRIGKIIRKLRIDELPQIINVLKNEMSFVGPRPERPYFVELLNKEAPYYDVRHSIKPGITGWAQVRYPYGASIDDATAKLHYDLYYVKNHSLFLDIVILFRTIKVVILGKGGR